MHHLVFRPGCPYRCSIAFHLWIGCSKFPARSLSADLDLLIQRGTRQFKFLDRTFQPGPSVSTAILRFFLAHAARTFYHFEMVPIDVV